MCRYKVIARGASSLSRISKKKKLTKSRGRPVATRAEEARVARYRSLVDIGIALSAEKEVGRILDLILEKALENTNADAASIYLLESIRIDTIANAKKIFPVLRFHRSTNRTTGRRILNKVLELDHSSIAGYVALTGETVLVEDCYQLSTESPFQFNPAVDKETGYKTISMLAVPMRSSNDKIRGVLQIINKMKPHEVSRREDTPPTFDPQSVIAFTEDDVELMSAFASQGAVAIENAKLTEDIENLFESFIRASVTAIEARDPITSGHSDRVAVLAVEFARAVHQCPSGPFKDLIFSEQQIRELRYAALLHDFGKIGVKEAVLNKRHKLFPHEMETILLRLDSVRARQEMLTWKEMAHELIEMFEKGHPHSPRAKLSDVTRRIDQFAQQLQQVRLSIIKANQPQIREEDFDIVSLMGWINQTSQELESALLTPDEIIKLSLPKGSLGEEERREIESHVSHTYHFLRQIAWTEDLSSVADIAHAHHEKCDGSGYPRGLTAEHIPIQAKMMTISDIYDALTSMDRPYKKAASPERALEILHFEARNGKLDLDLLRVFVEGEVFRTSQGMQTRRSA